MNDFIYSVPVKVYWGTDAAKKTISQELRPYGRNVMLAYGERAVRRSCVYGEVFDILLECR